MPNLVKLPSRDRIVEFPSGRIIPPTEAAFLRTKQEGEEKVKESDEEIQRKKAEAKIKSDHEQKTSAMQIEFSELKNKGRTFEQVMDAIDLSSEIEDKSLAREVAKEVFRG